MSEAAAASEIVSALARAARVAAEAAAPLVSIEIAWLAAGDVARVETRVVRKTRTLLFMGADAFGADGAHVASGSSVHRVGD
ncbi:hypothetical protein U91I_04087 [alpha proteobacterium U9-1i]|nr:hypothetical protein U91I_04087 [alpha proteobacterium U9-1i]